MKIVPLRGYTLIEPLEAEEQSDGIYLPDSSKDPQSKGKVLKVGLPQILPNGTETHVEIKEGMTVYHKRFTDNTIKDGDKELKLVPFQDILAIIE